MRNLKRALSLALAAAMLIGMMVVGASAEYKDQASVSQTEAVDVLTGLGVVGGDQNGNYNPTATLTRAEFCVMIANALTGGKFDSALFDGTTTPFTDVAGHWGAPYIAYCYSAGVIAGTSATTFSPDNTLTAAQASAILLSALGYNRAGEFGLNGQFELNVTTWAQKAGLYEGLSMSAVAGISRENAARVIFNALTVATPVEYNSAFAMYNTVGNGLNGVVSGDTNYSLTLAYKNFKLYHTSKTTPIAVTYGPADGVTGSTYRVVAPVGGGSYNIAVDANQIGRVGYVWYTVNEKGEATAVSDLIYTDTVLATVSNGKGMSAWTTKGNNDFVAELDFTYNGATAGTDDNYIVNGADGALYSTLSTLDTEKGVVFTFVDTDANGKADVVYVDNRTVVTLTGDAATKTSGGKTIVTVPGVAGLNFSNNVETKDVIGYEGLVKDDVILWYQDGQTNKFIIEKAESATGTLTAIKDKDYTVGGVTYKSAGTSSADVFATASITTANLNKEVQVWLDASGYAVKAKAIDKAALPYALVMDYDAQTMSGQMTKLLTADGQFITATAQYYSGNDKKEMVASGASSGQVDVAKGNTIVQYELKDGVYKLTGVSAATTTTEGTVSVSTITNNTASLGSVVGNADTKFILVDAQDNISVYTGVVSVPTTTGTMTAIGKGATASLVFVSSAVTTTTSASDIIYVFSTTPSISKDGDTTLYTYDVVKNGAITTETFSVNVQDGQVSDGNEIDGIAAYKVTNRDAKGYATAVVDATSPYNFTAALDTGKQAKSLTANTLVYDASSSILVDENTVVINVNKTTGALTEGSLSDIQATTTSGFDYSKIEVVAVVKDGAATNTAAYIFIMGTGTAA